MKIREINLLFPEIVFTKILNEVSDNELTKINDFVKSLEYKTIGKKPKNHLSLRSNSLNVFDLPELKKLADLIKKEFINFKNNILKYEYNDFIYTTSWVTKSNPKQESQYHNHANCLYSGIFYTNVNKDSGNLILNKMSKSNFLLKKSQDLDYNSDEIKINTLEKMVIFFPSHLHHKIGYNNSNITRYSIAFNFMPVGNLGFEDSQLYLGK